MADWPMMVAFPHVNVAFWAKSTMASLKRPNWAKWAKERVRSLISRMNSVRVTSRARASIVGEAKTRVERSVMNKRRNFMVGNDFVGVGDGARFWECRGWSHGHIHLSCGFDLLFLQWLAGTVFGFIYIDEELGISPHRVPPVPPEWALGLYPGTLPRRVVMMYIVGICTAYVLHV